MRSMIPRVFLAVLALLGPSIASAQPVGNRGVAVRDEGTPIGQARALNFVGTPVSCVYSGGVVTCTFTGGGSITAGTATDCTALSVWTTSAGQLLACGAAPHPSYDPATIRFTVGTGSTVGMGWVLGNFSSGAAGLWTTSPAPGAGNYRLYGDTSLTFINTPAGTLHLQAAGQNKVVVGGPSSGAVVAGAGMYITPGTALSDVAALSIVRTNNNAAVAKGVEITFIDTSSSAAFLPLQILGGAAGTTLLMSLSKAGQLVVGSGAVNAPSYTTTLGGTDTGFYSAGAASMTWSGGNTDTLTLVSTGIRATSTKVLGWASGASASTGFDTGLSRISAGVVGVGNGTAGNTSGRVQLTAVQYVTAARPTCDAAARGTTWYVAGGAGVLDTYEICRKDAADNYAWITLF